MRLFFDTSVLVASMVQSHPAHQRALPWLERARSRAAGFFVAAHSLAEAYAILTTLPLRPRIGPGLAWRLIGENVASRARAVALSAAEYRTTLERIGSQGLAGGTVYDALIARAAEKARADRLLTLNAADFRRAWPSGHDRIAEP